MGRRRSVIRQEINRVLLSGRPQDYVIVYVDRDPEAGQRLAELSASRVKAVSEWAMTLDDDNIIPLHRVVEIRGPGGAVVWRRGTKA
jgi:hypothetical protein